ncbi:MULTISPECIES: hypothetical protein [Thiorhodovibrio]|uniref:hypothetical protein n=1 Tax=Thiorhodovibrio TaxID=61593 RepID=UPI0019140A41|nr:MULTISPECIES: hypothetical protein [Thiorhodovibrio]MBK5969402.1 hypothetical protein [Thiorhodovibrio winogradskyi]WPL14903.1 hypothetical protein Thiosp_04759 [Thiorhodovibrio litoralis]
MRLFHSIFSRGDARGHYPESLIEQATERAIDGTDPRLRLLSGYRKQLRQPVIQAIDHVVALVDAIPAPVVAGASHHAADPRLNAVFSSSREMLTILSRDAALSAFLESPGGRGAEQVTALLLAERVERNILGMDLVGEQVRRDVPQVTVSFTAHRLVDPTADEAESRRQWKRRAFDHLLTLALTQIAEMRVERAELKGQQDILRRKLSALEQGGWSFAPAEAEHPDPAALQTELDKLSARLNTLGADQDVLHRHLEFLTEVLGEAPSQLWTEPVTLWLDPMNIQREEQEPSARPIEFMELRNVLKRQVVLLALSITPSDLPVREDLVTAAQRYFQ